MAAAAAAPTYAAAEQSAQAGGRKAELDRQHVVEDLFGHCQERADQEERHGEAPGAGERGGGLLEVAKEAGSLGAASPRRARARASRGRPRGDAERRPGTHERQPVVGLIEEPAD